VRENKKYELESLINLKGNGEDQFFYFMGNRKKND